MGSEDRPSFLLGFGWLRQIPRTRVCCKDLQTSVGDGELLLSKNESTDCSWLVFLVLATAAPRLFLPFCSFVVLVGRRRVCKMLSNFTFNGFGSVSHQQNRTNFFFRELLSSLCCCCRWPLNFIKREFWSNFEFRDLLRLCSRFICGGDKP